MGRDDPSLPAAVRTAAFDAAKPARRQEPFIALAKLENGGEAVVGVLERAARHRTARRADVEVAQQRDVMNRQGSGDAAAYLEELRRSADVSKNPKAFE